MLFRLTHKTWAWEYFYVGTSSLRHNKLPRLLWWSFNANLSLLEYFVIVCCWSHKKCFSKGELRKQNRSWSNCFYLCFPPESKCKALRLGVHLILIFYQYLTLTPEFFFLLPGKTAFAIVQQFSPKICNLLTLHSKKI